MARAARGPLFCVQKDEPARRESPRPLGLCVEPDAPALVTVCKRGASEYRELASLCRYRSPRIIQYVRNEHLLQKLHHRPPRRSPSAEHSILNVFPQFIGNEVRELEVYTRFLTPPADCSTTAFDTSVSGPFLREREKRGAPRKLTVLLEEARPDVRVFLLHSIRFRCEKEIRR